MDSRRQQKDLEGIEEEGDISNPKLQYLDKKIYFWIWGWQQTKRVLWGPFESENLAYEEGFAKLDADFSVVPLPTRDVARASRELRARVLDETADVNSAFRRFRHARNKGA